MSPVEQVQLPILGRPGRVFTGGDGQALLLVHGGWGGAEFHWSRVWDALASRFRVIAPELPGLGAVDQPALASIGEYARWLVALLDELRVDRAWCVGNSFGGAVSWSLAGRYPERCAGLALVNGFAVPRTPALLRQLGRIRFFRSLLSWTVGRVSYDPKLVGAAFAAPDNVPEDLRRLIREEWKLMVPRFADILVAGDGSPPPAVKPLLLWGEADRLPGTSREHAHRLERRLSGAKLKLLENAGHFPQLEVPEAFVGAIVEFVS